MGRKKFKRNHRKSKELADLIAAQYAARRAEKEGVKDYKIKVKRKPLTRKVVRPQPKADPSKPHNAHGYLLNEKGWLVHREVYRKIYGPIPAGWVVHHIDVCKTNNHPDNLVAMPRLVHDRLHEQMRSTGSVWSKKRQFQFLARRFTVLKLKPTRPWNLDQDGQTTCLRSEETAYQPT